MKMDVEWPTLLLVILSYLVFGLATTVLAQASLWFAIPLAAVAITLHASLTHEIIHGHPFRNRHLNAALVFPALNPFVPFGRFRDTHLDHHRDENLTDPYDDPESNYLDPGVWARYPVAMRALLRFNNTLLGRVTVGPIIGKASFFSEEWRRCRAGDSRVARSWLMHIPAVGIVVAWFWFVAPMTVWAYLAATYIAIAALRVRTFLEHRAHERASARTVIVEDRGPLAFLFLNNNLHVVHHMHPRVAWYRLPSLYAARREHYLTRNGGYRYASYAEVFRRHFVSAKDPVPHPLMSEQAAHRERTTPSAPLALPAQAAYAPPR